MSSQTKVAATCLAIAIPACVTSAEESSQFLEDLARPIPIGAAGILRVGGTQSLSEEQMDTLGENKEILARFFSSLAETDGEPRKFLTSDFAAMFESRMDVVDAVGVSEAQIIQIGIVEVEFSGARRLLIDCYLLILLEGDFFVSRFASNLAFQDGFWRIDSLQFY